MTTIQNDTDTSAEITYIIDAAHYEPGHTCNGSCRTITVNIQPGTLFTFDHDAENAGDVENALATHGLI